MDCNRKVTTMWIKLCVLLCVVHNTNGITGDPPLFSFPSNGLTISIDENEAGETQLFSVITDNIGGSDGITITTTPTNANIVYDSVNTQVELVAGASLDTETDSSYNIEVTAVNVGGISSSVVVTLSVTDLNDNTPAINAVSGTVSVLENSAEDTPVVTITATDGDATSQNNVIAFSITGVDADHFKIDASSGAITTTATPIVYATTQTASIVVTATDTGTPALSSSLAVSITVRTLPVFDFSSTVEVTFPENSGTNAVVSMVSPVPVTDEDSATSSLLLALDTSSANFAIDGLNIISLANVDYEANPSFSEDLTLVVTDTDGQSVTAAAVIRITIEDVNEAPVFTVPSSNPFNIIDTSPADTVIETLASTDEDAGDTPTYTITAGNTDDSFKISDDGTELQVKTSSLTARVYTLTLTVTDSGSLTDTQTFNIQVQTAPVISSPADGTIVSINENEAGATGGTSLFTVTSDDPGNDVVTISVSPASAIIVYDSVNTQVELVEAASLDTETDSSYTIVVTVVNVQGTGTSSVSATLTVTDLNDNTPAINAVSGTVSVLENAAVDTAVVTITATDGDDTPPNNVIAFSITGVDADHFKIDASSGAVTTTATPIVYATTPTASIIVTATDTGTSPLSSTLAVSITVRTLPVFGFSSTVGVTFPENSGTNAVVYTVTVTDEDDASLTLTIDSPSTNFGISGLTIISPADVDYEADTSFTEDITLVVTDTDGQSVTAAAVIRVTIGDVNEAPAFTAPTTNPFNIIDTSPVGTVIDTLASTDVDAGDTPIYTITAGNTDDSFKISDDGTELQVKTSSLTARVYTLTLTVTDSGSLSDTQTFNIHVQTAPVISSPADGTIVSINENEAGATGGTSLFTVTSDDPGNDVVTISTSPPNANIVYDSVNTQVELDAGASLDTETVPSYTIVVTVVNVQGTGTSSVSATLTVTDLNDNTPAINAVSGTVSVLENSAVDTAVVTITATDGDASSPNNVITFSITGVDADHFKIDASSGDVTTTAVPIVYATTPTASIIVTATDTDTGTQALSSTLAVSITVRTLPVFGFSSPVTFPENSGTNAVVYTVPVTDEDEDDALLTLTIDSSSANFGISGLNIISPADVDYEANPSFTEDITLVVTDTDGQSVTATAVITITIGDVNEAPVFTVPTSNPFYILDTSAVGTVIEILASTDVDTGDTSTYTIAIAGNIGDSFKISDDGTELQVKTTPLTAGVYTLILTVTDSGSLTDTQTFNIQVQTAPSFTAPVGDVSIDESASVEATVTPFAADGTAVTYTLSSTPSNDNFKILGTDLLVKNTLDYENVESYAVTITGINQVGTASVIFTVNVNDVNDVSPIIGATDPAAPFIVESSNAGTSVFSIAVSDGDTTAAFQSVTWTIPAGTYKDNFDINSSTGTVTASSTAIVYDTTGSPISIDVTATDDAGNTDTKTVSITVQALPVFSGSASGSIDENEAIGSTAYTITATDQDGSVDTLAIQGGSAEFELTGNDVVTKVVFDKEVTSGPFSLTIDATDSDSNIVSNQISIAINDVDELPVFTSSNSEVTVHETATVNDVVYTAVAEDPEGIAMTYDITAGNDAGKFKIVGDEVQVAATFDPGAASYTLTISATDGTSTPTELNLPVRVLAAPVFTAAGTTVSYDEDTAAPTTLFSFDATGEPTITYHFSSVPDESNFNIVGKDFDLLGVLDYEVTTSYTVKIEARNDIGTATATFVITVNDVNDEDPVFAANVPVSPSVLEETSGVSVVQISTTDADPSPAFGIHTYTLSGDAAAFMTIDATGLVITSNTNLQYTSFTSIDLTVTASDMVNTNAQTITIAVQTAPRFVIFFEPSSVPLAENPTTGHVVASVGTTDADSAATPTVTLITSTTYFTMSGNDLVTNDMQFDFEGSPTTFDLTFLVTDSDSLTRTSDVVTITLTDVNEPPVITDAGDVINILNTATVGTTLYTITATDPEGTSLTYAIPSGITGDKFEIAGSTVVVKNTLSTGDTFTLGITASDGTNSAPVTINVVVQTAALFTSPADSAVIPLSEDASGGSVVTGFTAVGDATITYTFTSTPDHNNFEIVGLDFKLKAAGSVDRETVESYSIVLTADNGIDPPADTLTITVSITDVNDVIPILSLTPAAPYGILENTAAGTSIFTAAATDTDVSVEFNTIIFSLTGVGAAFLDIDPSTGEVTTSTPANPILFSNGATFSVTVVASDTLNEPSESVTFNVKTIPVFTDYAGPVTLTLAENSPQGTTIIPNIAVTDADGDPVTISIKGGPSSNFEIVSDKLVTKNVPFDFETSPNSFPLTLEATDGENVVDSGPLTVLLTDVNEPPSYTSSFADFSIPFTTATGTEIYTIVADDPEGDSLTYTITGGNGDSVFDISVDKIVTTAVALNTGGYSHTLTISVDDGTNPLVDSTLNIKIDTNPVWTNPAPSGGAITVSEDLSAGSQVKILTGTDADGDSLTYSIVSQSPASPTDLFVLDTSNNARLNVGAGGLDVDSGAFTSPVTLTIRVTDGTTPTDTNYVITVDDINDNNPVFSPNSYTVYKQETLPTGSTIQTVVATDADLTSAFNALTYSIPGGSIFSMTGADIILDAALNYDTTSSYTLTVTASDPDSNTDTATVNVNVKTTPTFDLPPTIGVTVTADEDITLDVVYTIAATDRDSDTLTYAIETASHVGKFGLAGTSGRDVKLASLQSLDYETFIGPYTLTFRATDVDGNYIVSPVLTINVNDVNDFTPVFDSPVLLKTIRSNTETSTSVIQVAATDGDATAPNDVITFSFGTGNTDNDFTIDGSTGEITVANALNSVTKPVYILQVLATDSGTNPSARTGTAVFTVTVVIPTDPVITAPVEGSNVVLSYPEDQSVPTTVFAILATDADGDSLVYSIKSQNPSPKFSLTGNVLMLTTALDYETEQSYIVDFYVDDNDGNTANKKTSGTLTINVIDMNDNIPVFSQAVYIVDVVEQHTEVTSVLQFSATDADSGVNGQLTYSIVAGNQDGLLGVTPSGMLYTSNQGFSLNQQKYLQVAVQAHDGGTPAKADSVHVQINVVPVPTTGSGSESVFTIWRSFLLLIACLVILQI